MKYLTAHRLIEFLVGLLFGWGLMIAGMTDPGKVIGFLDLAGPWDPSLALVMGGAIAVGVLAFSAARKRTRTLLGGAFHLPTSRDVDRPLVIGSLLFGAGWGLAGFAQALRSCLWRRGRARPWCSSWPWWLAWPFMSSWTA